MFARQRPSHFASGERHPLPTWEEAFKGTQLPEQSWMELGPMGSKEG